MFEPVFLAQTHALQENFASKNLDFNEEVSFAETKTT